MNFVPVKTLFKEGNKVFKGCYKRYLYLQVWMNEVETLMSLEDLGHDLSSVKFLLKKHQGVETDIEVHFAQIQTLCDQAQGLIEGGHFDAVRIEQGTENMLQRY